jgi:hypothetical protein
MILAGVHMVEKLRPVWACLLGALVVVALLTAVPGAEATPREPAIGASAGFAEGDRLLWRSDADLDRELDGIAATGARWLRVDVDWSVVERQQSVYDWQVIDRVIFRARDRGLNVLGMLAYTPAWARPTGTTDKHPPTDPRPFAAFARAAVERYAPHGVSAWEIWNEPNHRPFWQPQPDVPAYVRLLQAAYGAVKSADPGAQVITAGLSPAPDSSDGSAIAPATFVSQMYAYGAGGYFDAIGLHPSTFPSMPLREEPDPNWNAFSGALPQIHEILEAHGDGAKKVWATEMGAPTIGGLDDAFLSAYLTEAYLAWVDKTWTGPMFWYSYLDAAVDPHDIEANFGLLRRNFTEKGDALRVFTSIMERTAAAGRDG